MDMVIETRNLCKTYKIGEVEIKALRGVNFSIDKGEFVAVMGSSGSGKSTLMNLLGCLDKPSSGDFFLDGINTNGLSKNEYAAIRNQKIGFVFQGFNLLPRTTALENVELPLLYDRQKKHANSAQKARNALCRVSLQDRFEHLPGQLSGGQQQRVAIARALVNDPALILADEPTGNLDSYTSMEVFSLFQQLNDEGITIVLVTHERDFARYAKRVIELKDGRIIRDALIQNRLYAKEDLKLFKQSEIITPI
ncbi:MAG: ABC transporter ATP-binding protein [Bacteroidota bacterium]|nr:ABC transporter ATP-binding protein [Bacteroidota bacterium]MDP4190328.1 ABC transporter ATP-binding protein [Bacteroidota bacterium]MDP4193544.1 ABC transporter ATP-binding protein [Bacteroidota bacterium]